MIAILADFISSRPRAVVSAWVLLLAAAALSPLLRGTISNPASTEVLSSDQPAIHGASQLRQAFPKLAAESDVVLVFAREPFLTAADETIVGNVAAALRDKFRGTWSVRSVATEPALAARFVARDAASRPVVSLIVMSSDQQYDSDAVIDDVDRIETMTRSASASAAAGLKIEVTGSGALGRDQAIAENRAHRRITFASVFAVMIVLLSVYRAPLAASVPLLCVAASALVSTETLQLLRSYGAPISSEELTYLVVIVFGAGTDFALFWLSRFDEELASSEARTRAEAARRAYVATVPGIASSAATTILGLCGLLVSVFRPNHALGLSMAFSLFVALAASITLMPAIALTMGSRLFWPRRKPMSAGASAGRWAKAGAWVTRKPWVTVLVLCALIAAPLWISFRVNYRVETDAAVLPDAGFLRGEVIAEKYFGRGMLFPWTALVEFESDEAVRRFLDEQSAVSSVPSLVGHRNAKLDELSTAVATALKGAQPDTDVWSFAAPLGQRSAVGSTLATLLAPGALANYWNPATHTLRFEVMASEAPFSPAAIREFRRALATTQDLIARQKIPATVLATGPTPLAANLDALTTPDEWRVKTAVVVVVALVVFLLTRDLLLTAVLMLITLLAYQATMGLTAILFVHVLGYPALNWEVKMFAFVILMAIGQDYNLFLISRLLEERRQHGLRYAVRESMMRTGGIISSCGVITAVSLGSLVASQQFYLAQLGFAFAAGTLLDTFLVRPFLLPALLVLLRRPARPTSRMRAG